MELKKTIPKKKQYAKEVADITEFRITRRRIQTNFLGCFYTFAYFYKVDRTLQRHRYKYDVDVRKPSAKNGKNIWIYWGSHNDIEKAREMIKENVKQELGSDAEARIVEAKTGFVLEIWR